MNALYVLVIIIYGIQYLKLKLACTIIYTFNFCLKYPLIFVVWCNTQIGGFPPIYTHKTHRQIENKLVTISAVFLVWQNRPFFLVGEESFGVTLVFCGTQ